MFIRYDNVTILNANQQILAGPYCGDTNIPPTYTSTGNQATVKFMSDPGATKSGFDISYTCKGGPGTTVPPTPTPGTTQGPNCGYVHLTDPSGMITSPYWPNDYPSNTVCNWGIECGLGQYVELTFDAFDLETHPTCQ